MEFNWLPNQEQATTKEALQLTPATTNTGCPLFKLTDGGKSFFPHGFNFGTNSLELVTGIMLHKKVQCGDYSAEGDEGVGR